MTTMYQKFGPWKQGIYEISVAPTEIVGTKREDMFGNIYRYARAGAVALAAGVNTTSPGGNADWTNESVTAAVAVGGKRVSITHVAVGVDLIPENYFKGGQLQINDADGEGIWYRIIHSTEIDATSTVCTFTLEEGVRVALATTSEATPVQSPWMATVIAATETDNPAGVPLVAVTAAYYYWSQTRGLGLYWADGDVAAVGTALILGADDGKLIPWVLDLDATNDADVTRCVVARAVHRATPVDTEFCPCYYLID